MEFGSLTDNKLEFKSNLVLSRTQEKHALRLLNQRFVKFKEKVKLLKRQNELLEAKIEQLENAKSIQSTTHLQERMHVLQKNLENATKEKTKKLIELEKIFKQLDCCQKNSNREISAIQELETISFSLRKDIDEATLKKITLEGQVEQLNMELALLRGTFDRNYQDLAERISAARKNSIFMLQPHEGDLSKSLQEARNDAEPPTGIEANEMENYYRAKEEKISKLTAKKKKSNQGVAMEIKHHNKQSKRLQVDLQTASVLNSVLENQLNLIENRNRNEFEIYDQKIRNLENTILDAKAFEIHLEEKFSHLISSKLSLEAEIESYRRLIEESHNRLPQTYEKERSNSSPTEALDYGMNHNYYTLYHNTDNLDDETFKDSNPETFKHYEVANPDVSAHDRHRAIGSLTNRCSETWSVEAVEIEYTEDDDPVL